MLKHVVPRPDWLTAPQVREICAVSHCISKAFAEYIAFWAHNDFWLFDRPAVIGDLAATHAIDTEGARLFYYEAHDQEWDDRWRPLRLPGDFPLAVEPPMNARLLGYDVVTWGDVFECSLLSCNRMAAELPANAHCLFDTLEAAQSAIEAGRFEGCEPGVYRILSVSEVA